MIRYHNLATKHQQTKERDNKPPLDFEILYFPANFSVEKFLSVSFKLVKRNFTTVGSLLEKCVCPPPGKIHISPLEKIFPKPMLLCV